MQEFIVIKGAREHNLKDFDLSIPRDKATVITGPSGSGKSSLAMDTIYAEGQRRYVQSLSAYARQFLDRLKKPDIDLIEGLSPSVAIDQRTVTRNPRSTVGTITEIYDYMRVLYTTIGRPLCHNCGSKITTQEAENIISGVMALPAGSRIQVLSPIVRDRKGQYKKELLEMRAEGFVMARIDGEMTDITQEVTLARQKRHTIEIVIDRLIIKPNVGRQLRGSIETALRYSDTVVINLTDRDEDIPFSRTLACPKCGISYPEITPRFFSFNSKLGACRHCGGLGLEPLDEDAPEDHAPAQPPCRACQGLRLRKEALSVKIGGQSIGGFADMPVSDALGFIKGLKLTDKEKFISARVLKEVSDRLGFLIRVGLDYLTLNRSSMTLSGGEAQRIRLATQMGSTLTGVLYVLDEPTIGLHPRDCGRLLKSLAEVRDRGNTIIIVEHDEETMRWADYLVDMGPGAGTKGGWVVAAGPPDEISRDKRSLTGSYLNGSMSIPVPKKRRTPSGFLTVHGASEFNLKNIDVKFPLKVFTCVTGVSGSGKSTLVLDILLRRLHHELHGGAALLPLPPGSHGEITGLEGIDKAICVEQSPLGRTPRSNPATYTGILTPVRELLSGSEDSKIRGYTASRFSFNLKGGRCETCRGDGLRKVAMHFLPDVFVPCESCKGARYNKETLDIKYKGKDISEILDMTVSEALAFFKAVPAIRQKLEVLEDVGLGYLRLGQSAPTLSGGEAQRVRLSRELAKKSTGRTLYIMDEPTTGLHFVDMQRLLGVIDSLVEMGNTVVVIEHNLDVIKSADHIIDLGPEGGAGGGYLMAEGTPEQVCANPASHTGRYLRDKLPAAVKAKNVKKSARKAKKTAVGGGGA